MNKRALNHIKAKCPKCDAEVDERYERDGKFYCASHFESESSSEKLANKIKKDEIKNYQKMFR